MSPRLEPFGFAIYDENSSNGVEIGTPPQRAFFAKLEHGTVAKLGATELQVAITDARPETLSGTRAIYHPPAG